VAWLLTLALRNNRAALRYWIWLAASVKFLIPFASLVWIGGEFGWRTVPEIAPSQFSFAMDAMEQIGGPFARRAIAPAAAPQAGNPVPAILLTVWIGGFIIGVFHWLRCWRRIRAIQRSATPLLLGLPLPVMSSTARLEPGVFGIRSPVLLLPEGIAERLTQPQLQAVLAHELCHVRRRDNLTAAIHMAVETIFWFHPLVRWIGARLVEERERACDDEALRVAGEPEVYAEGILAVCKCYLESPLVCLSGITGSDLKKRIEEIISPRATHNLDRRRKLLLAVAGTAALAGPVAIGLVNAPTGRAQPQPPPALAFEVASVKSNKSGAIREPSGILPGGRFYRN
jgi:bla regulator protein BlaR1